MNKNHKSTTPLNYFSLNSKLIAQSIFMGAMCYFLVSFSEASANETLRGEALLKETAGEEAHSSDRLDSRDSRSNQISGDK